MSSPVRQSLQCFIKGTDNSYFIWLLDRPRCVGRHEVNPIENFAALPERQFWFKWG